MPENRSILRGYIFAVAATTIAFLIRLSLDSYLGEKLPFGTSVIAIVLVAWYGGFVPSLLTFFVSYLLVDWFFVPPRHSIFVADGAHLAGNFSYIFVGLTIIFFGRSLHEARKRADANARQAISNLAQLQDEMVERKRVEDEVLRLNGELEQRVKDRTAELMVVNQDLEAFSYSVSHDLRAPLRHIDGYTQLLEEEYGKQLPEGALKYTGKIRNGSRSLGQLVDDLLELSRMGKREIIRKTVDLKSLVEQAMGEVQPETANRQIEWKIGELPSTECDGSLVKQAFVNLLSNAVKYTRPREKARIEVGQLKVDGKTAIYVRDNGVGFNMKYAGKLFGVFQRLHRPDQFEGTGVGLATVARIVRKHGGRIWVEAELEKGATFMFTLEPSNGKAPAPVNGKSA
jgi:signal transduction histidine kinase